MRLRGTILFVAALSLLPRLPLAADERESGKADHFQAEIKKLGGYVYRDKQRPGSPVVAVDLRGPQVTDAALDLLASQNAAYLRDVAAPKYESVNQLKGSMSRDNVPNRETYERANYVKTLVSYTAKMP